MTTKLDQLMDDLIDALIKHQVGTQRLRDDLREWVNDQLPTLDQPEARG